MTVVTVPSSDPSVPPITTLTKPPVPSPLIGIFVIVLSLFVSQLVATPAVGILIISILPSVNPFPDSAAVGTGIKSGVKKF